MPNLTRTFTREELEAIGVPDEWTADEGKLAKRLHEEQTDTRRWVSVHKLIFRAADDGKAYAVYYEQGLTESQDDTDPWNYDDTVTATAVEEQQVTVTKWVPVVAAEVTP
jgi:hypothetical protein